MNSAAIERKFSNIRDVSPKTCSCVWTTKTFTAIRSDMREDLKYSDYGYSSGCEFYLKVPKSEIGATWPGVNDDITIDGVAKRIVGSVQEDSAGAVLILQIGDERA